MKVLIKQSSRGWQVKFAFKGNDAPDLRIAKYYTRHTTAARGAERVIDRMIGFGTIRLKFMGESASGVRVYSVEGF